MQSTSSVRTFRPSAPEEPKKQPKPKKDKAPKERKPVVLPRLPGKKLPWVLVIVLLAVSLFMFQQWHEAKQKLEAPTPAVKAKQAESTVSQVGKLILLPTDEKPTIISVKDASKLKGEQFYNDAKNGDITLVYTKHKRAILYRPESDIIVNVAPVNVTPSSTTQ